MACFQSESLPLNSSFQHHSKRRSQQDRYATDIRLDTRPDMLHVWLLLKNVKLPPERQQIDRPDISLSWSAAICWAVRHAYHDRPTASSKWMQSILISLEYHLKCSMNVELPPESAPMTRVSGLTEQKNINRDALYAPGTLCCRLCTGRRGVLLQAYGL